MSGVADRARTVGSKVAGDMTAASLALTFGVFALAVVGVLVAAWWIESGD